MREIFGILSTDWKKYLHYAILVAAIIAFYHYNEVHAVHASNWIIVGLFLVLAIADQIIHKVLKI